jgi:hypothetical protein
MKAEAVLPHYDRDTKESIQSTFLQTRGKSTVRIP